MTTPPQSEVPVKSFRTPTLAVIVPAFNVAKYVAEALDSLRNQTKAPDEVIVVDDGSTDGTTTILRNYRDLPGWKVIRTRNNGLGPARNLGRALAKSDYVYYFDSDDILESHFVSRMHETIKENRYPDIIMFSGKAFREPGFHHSFSPTYQRTLAGQYARGSGLISKLDRRNEAWAQACLYVTKSELWSRNRIFFPPHLREDEAVLFPLLACSNNTVVLSEVYFLRRIRPGSVMTSAKDAHHVSGALRALNETMEFMARESRLVRNDLPAWRSRVSHCGIRYLRLSLETGNAISWAPVVGSLFAVRGIKYPMRIAYTLLPQRIQFSLRSITCLLRGVR